MLCVVPEATCGWCVPVCLCGWQVEDDKAQITAVIQQLDEKKRIALEETWKQVRPSYCAGTLEPLMVQLPRVSSRVDATSSLPKNALVRKHIGAIVLCSASMPFMRGCAYTARAITYLPPHNHTTGCCVCTTLAG